MLGCKGKWTGIDGPGVAPGWQVTKAWQFQRSNDQLDSAEILACGLGSKGRLFLCGRCGRRSSHTVGMA